MGRLAKRDFGGPGLDPPLNTTPGRLSTLHRRTFVTEKFSPVTEQFGVRLFG
jgi:hypothetical protein